MPLVARWINATQRNGESVHHHMWNDADTRVLWKQHMPHLLSMYDALTEPVMRADASRLLYMHVHGGIWADLDTAPCNSSSLWDTIEQQNRTLVLIRDPALGNKGDEQPPSTFFYASAPGHPFWGHALRTLAARMASNVRIL